MRATSLQEQVAAARAWNVGRLGGVRATIARAMAAGAPGALLEAATIDESDRATSDDVDGKVGAASSAEADAAKHAVDAAPIVSGEGLAASHASGVRAERPDEVSPAASAAAMAEAAAAAAPAAAANPRLGADGSASRSIDSGEEYVQQPFMQQQHAAQAGCPCAGQIDRLHVVSGLGPTVRHLLSSVASCCRAALALASQVQHAQARSARRHRRAGSPPRAGLTWTTLCCPRRLPLLAWA